MVWIFRSIGCDGKCFQAHVDASHRSSSGKRLHLQISTAQGDKVFPAGILADCGRENAPLYLFADSTLYKAELRELYSTIKHFDVLPNALAFVASPMVALALEPWIAGFLALLHTPEEVLIGSV